MATATEELSDEEWCVLDLLMRSKELDVPFLTRQHILSSEALPDGVKVKLTFKLLTLSGSPWVHHEKAGDKFSITEAGAQLYTARFGKACKTLHASPALDVICLPDQSQRVN